MSMLDRREFLKHLQAGLAAFCLPGFSDALAAAAVPARKGKLAFCLWNGPGKRSTLRVFDWDRGRSEDLPIPLNIPHSVIQDRKDKDVLYVFEIFGSGLRVDLRTKEFVRIDHRETGEIFVGHATQSLSGELLFCTQKCAPPLSGQIVVRDARTLKRLGVAPDECGRSHHVVHLPGSTLIATGAHLGKGEEQRGAITFYDYGKGKVVEQIETAHPVSHVLPLSPDSAVGVTRLTVPKGFNYAAEVNANSSAYQNISRFLDHQEVLPSPLYFAQIGKPVKSFWDESAKSGFRGGVGVAQVKSRGAFLTTHSASDKVFLWKDFQVLHEFDVPYPLGIAVASDESEFMVSGRRQVKVFSLETFRETKHLDLDVLAMGTYS